MKKEVDGKETIAHIFEVSGSRPNSYYSNRANEDRDVFNTVHHPTLSRHQTDPDNSSRRRRLIQSRSSPNDLLFETKE